MLLELARKNLKLGVVQIGQLSAKQLRIDREKWEWPKKTPSAMATYADVA